MLWVKIAWRNLWRNRRRTGIQLAVIIGSMFLSVFYINFADGALATMVRAGVRSGSGDIAIYRQGYLSDRRLSDTFPAAPILAGLARDPDVAQVFPRVRVPGLLQSAYGSRPAEAEGLDFGREAGTNPLLDRKYFVAGGLPHGPTGIVLGQTLARNLKVKVKNKVVWMAQDARGQIASGLFRVSGIIHTDVGAVDAGMVMAPREAMASLIGRAGQVHEIAVLLKDPQQASPALARLGPILKAVPGTRAYPWQRAMPDLASLIEISAAKQKFTVFILFVIVAIGTLNTMLMSVMERTREFGMMRAIGISKRAIRQMIMAEALVLSMVGAAGGLVLAILVGLRTSTAGIDMSGVLKGMDVGIAVDPIIKTGWDWPVTAALFAGTVVLCLVASLYPVRWALKIRPADAMRTY